MNEMKKKTNQERAEFIIEEREKRQWSQEVLAGESGVSSRTIQRLEAGENPSTETLIAVAKPLEIEPDELIYLSDELVNKYRERKVHYLKRLRNSDEFFKVISGADRFIHTYDDLKNEGQIALAKKVFEDINNYSALWNDIHLLRKAENEIGVTLSDSEDDVDKIIKEVESYGFSFFGDQRRSDFKDGDKKPVLSTLVIIPANSPKITKSEKTGHEVLSALMSE